MGLAIVSEDGKTKLYSKPYSAFYRFRQHIGESLQKVRQDSIRQLEEPSGPTAGGEESRTDRLLTLVNQTGRFDSAVHAFFNHSDCDGEWSAEECALVRDLLRVVEGMTLVERKASKNEEEEEEKEKEKKPDLLSDMPPEFLQFLISLVGSTPSEEEDLQMLMKGLDYCIEHNQKAIFC